MLQHSCCHRLTQGVAIAAVAMLGTGCTSDFPSSVTCDGLRSLRSGMPPAQVEAVLGRPALEFSATRLGPSGETWAYVPRNSLFGGAKLEVDFADGGLVAVHAYLRHVWDSRNEYLYRLDSNGAAEGQRFTRYFRCGQP